MNPHTKRGWVYIMASGPHGTLYIGVTFNLASRVHQHKTGKGSEFCKRYGVRLLVYVEEYSNMSDAIAREKAMKAWKRQWKLRLIRSTNPEWIDLYDQINA